jgi:hypothetical protein
MFASPRHRVPFTWANLRWPSAFCFEGKGAGIVKKNRGLQPAGEIARTLCLQLNRQDACNPLKPTIPP